MSEKLTIETRNYWYTYSQRSCHYVIAISLYGEAELNRKANTIKKIRIKTQKATFS